jgi:hypothetical protein
MKKVIVFRVEGVLVKDYDVLKMYDLKVRRLVKGMLKKENVELKGEEWEEMKKEVEELKKGFEENGDVEKRLKMRDVLRRMEEMENEGKERMLEMRRKFMDGSFEKRKMSVREDLEDLGRVRDLVGDMRLVFVSGYGRMKVMRLLKNNGLKEFEVVGSMDELEVVEKENMIVFGCEEDVEKMEGMGVKSVLGVRDMWKEIGIIRNR